MSTAAPSPEIRVRQRDRLAITSLLLGLLLIVFPVQADILDAALHARRFFAAGIVAVTCFAAVFVPFLLSLRRRRREPQLWANRGCLIATGIILVLDVLFLGTLLIYQAFR
jgi:hypothetical protein